MQHLGVPNTEINSLARAIEDDSSEGQAYGGRTQSWLSGATKKIASGAWQVTLASASQVIVALVKKYSGLP